MSTLTLLSDMATGLPETVSFRRDRCLRRRLSGWGCRRCVDCCPGSAISIDDNQIALDGSRCSGCMACSTACPNDAFELDGFDLERKMYSLPVREQTVISCPRQSQAFPEEFLIPCVGAFSIEHMLFFGIRHTGRVVFNLSACASCVNADISRRFTGLFMLLQNCAFPVLNADLSVVVNSEDSSATMAKNRRSYLTGFRNGLAAVLAARPSRTPGDSGVTSGTRRIPRTVRLVRELLGSAEGARRELVSWLCLHRIEIGERCSSCPLCKGICPTGAISIERSGGEKNIQIDRTLCSGCGLCAGFCKHDALRLLGPQKYQDRSDQSIGTTEYPWA